MDKHGRDYRGCGNDTDRVCVAMDCTGGGFGDYVDGGEDIIEMI